MELKDVILSTLAELEDEVIDETLSSSVSSFEKTSQYFEIEIQVDEEYEQKIDSELAYLSSIRERLLVLFEGFQAPNNSNIEAKVDMTLNFLEYTLATIDERVQALEKGNTR
jgi:hypothetical protein